MVIVLFGVSGAGKTTVGKLLADDLRWSFIDADDYHSSGNVEKMRAGIALDDDDRAGWLNAIALEIRNHLDNRKDLVLACSALKAAYREVLEISDQVIFVFLRADPETTAVRLAQRSGHFMNPALLESQFQTLEEPGPETTTIDTRQEPQVIVQMIKRQIFDHVASNNPQSSDQDLKGS